MTIASKVVTRPGEPASLAWTPLRSRTRWLVVLATLVAAVAHVPVIAPHLSQAPYIGEEFIVLTVACLLLAIATAVCDSVAVYALVVLTCGLAALGYLLTRLIAFPQLADDKGNWLEPLGIASISAEAFAVATAVVALATVAQATRARRSAANIRPQRRDGARLPLTWARV